jgi:hypothetical protein
MTPQATIRRRFLLSNARAALDEPESEPFGNEEGKN